MGNFNINPLKKDRLEHLRLLQYFAFEFFCSLYFTVNEVGKNSKNLSNTTTSYWILSGLSYFLVDKLAF